ncbi:DUF499 domain-containing protein [Vulcanisaeta thermophila]|uniref:DUF499 domain-containing protein n=1 Tax=Vulcanisaeta thermophila TaxID=867917 RepID=UPI000852AE80|nr:DUF499 domain-containing protein [Vulcanisaeta thermophila]
MSLVKALAEGKVSSAVDVYEVYRVLFKGEKPQPAYEPYCDSEKFFSITYVTPAFKQYLMDFLSKLSKNESEVYLMPAILGAGKSHFLALVLHVIKLYSICSGVGDCIRRKLASYGIDINAPNLNRVPAVYVFHGQYEIRDEGKELMEVWDKEKLRGILRNKSPVVLIFDETQYFESKIRDFPLWIQMLAEVVRDIPGVFLFVSFSLFPGEKPELSVSKSQDAVKRVSPVLVSLDTVNNIAFIFRRWAGLSVGNVDATPLKGVVDDKFMIDFSKRVSETYPFNPLFLDVMLQLANESIIERTRVQLTRELLRTLARAYLNVNKGELVVFTHLPEPDELLVIGGPYAGFWNALLNVYRQDVERIRDYAKNSNDPHFEKVAISALRHVLLITFLNKLLPSPMAYPSEDEIIVGSYNGVDVKPTDIRGFLQSVVSLGLHIERLSGNRYIYWYIGDVTDAINKAILKFGDDKALDFVANQIASMLRDKVGVFSNVYISGLSELGPFGKVRVVPKDRWDELLRDSDNSVLAVDILDFGIPSKRNNLVVIGHDDKADIPMVVREILGEIYREPSDLKRAVIELSKAVMAVDDVKENLYDYFAGLFGIDDETLKKEFEDLLRNRLETWRKRIEQALSSAIMAWLRPAFVGFRDVRNNRFNRLDDFIRDLSKSKRDDEGKLVEQLFESGIISWNSFVKLGDLWSMYLNNDGFPAIPISFNEFVRLVKDYCDGGCNCIYEVGDRVHWLSEDGCDKTILSRGDVRNVGLVPVIAGKRVNEWAIERYLNQLAQERDKRYVIVYKKPTGEEVRRSVYDLLVYRDDWIYLKDGRIEVERGLGKQIAVLVDNIPTAVVERQPDSDINVVVETDANIDSVIYKINNVEKKLEVNGRTASFKVKVPREPGRYDLNLDIIFKDGSRDSRAIIVNVKGKCRKLETVYRLSQGDLIKSIQVNNTGVADDLVNYLLRRNIAFTIRLSTKKEEPNEELSLSARFVIKDRNSGDKVVRLLRAVGSVNPLIDGVFEFDNAIEVDSDMVMWFKNRSGIVFKVERETEC